MATDAEKEEILEFLGNNFGGGSGNPADPRLIADWIAELVYGDNQRVKTAKDKYKDHLDAKITKIEESIAALDTEKQAALDRLNSEKAKKQAEKDKVV